MLINNKLSVPVQYSIFKHHHFWKIQLLIKREVVLNKKKHNFFIYNYFTFN